CDALYEQLRCGMAHDGMLRHKVFIMNNARAPITVAAPQATGIDGGISAIVVNPALILNGIEHHFERYVTHLRNPESRQLRDNFTRTWERPNAEMLVFTAGFFESISRAANQSPRSRRGISAMSAGNCRPLALQAKAAA